MKSNHDKLLTIICPITSRGMSPNLHEQPIFHALLPTLKRLGIWDLVDLHLGYDRGDFIWDSAESRSTIDANWIELVDCTGNITKIWNEMHKAIGAYSYLIPANDDLELLTSPIPAIEMLRARKDFGLIGFDDTACPLLTTFFVINSLHAEIFGDFYPVPWTGAHQDTWIADVYRPWNVSEIEPTIKCHNRMGGITEPRFGYGDAPNYREVVRKARTRVNTWLTYHDHIASPLPLETLYNTRYVI